MAACISGCRAQEAELQERLMQVGAQYGCDDFDGYCWVRFKNLAEFDAATGILAESSGRVDIAILEGGRIEDKQLSQLRNISPLTELHLADVNVVGGDFYLPGVVVVHLPQGKEPGAILRNFPDVTTVWLSANQIGGGLISDLNQNETISRLNIKGVGDPEELTPLLDLVHVKIVAFVLGKEADRGTVPMSLRDKFQVQVLRVQSKN